jgi:secondary thiamine-phosphate synthase enzyme
VGEEEGEGLFDVAPTRSSGCRFRRASRSSTRSTRRALFVNEFQSALMDDLKRLIERLVPERDGYRHDDPRVSDCERGNAHSHLRAALIGRSIALGINNGELTLGRFQSIIFAELDGPRKREISVQVIGA